jgi:hypothetical protein
VICPDCGSELDDFGPCSCVVNSGGGRAPFGRAATQPMAPRQSMRTMVARKLRRIAEEKASALDDMARVAANSLADALPDDLDGGAENIVIRQRGT